MNKKTNLGIFVCLLFFTIALFGCSKTPHYFLYHTHALPEMSFTNATIIDIVSTENAAVAKASQGSITQVVFLNTAPTDIRIVPSNDPYKSEMESLAATYRTDETNWMNRGACGFETFRYTGMFRCYLECDLMMLAAWAQLDFKETEQGVYLSREPLHLECRAYKIGDGLKQMAEALKTKNQIRVDFDPVASAFTDVTKVSLWSIDVPTSANELTGEIRYSSVFRYLPEKSVLLVIETPEAHQLAEQKLKENKLWIP
jgi:hypothetical protein